MFTRIIKELLRTKMAGSNEIMLCQILIKLIMNMKTASTSQEELRDVSNNITLNTPIHQLLYIWIMDIIITESVSH